MPSRSESAGSKSKPTSTTTSSARPPVTTAGSGRTTCACSARRCRKMRRCAVSTKSAAKTIRRHVIWRTDRFLRGGDQQSFTDQGFPGTRYVEQSENYEHQHQTLRVENGIEYGDLVKFIDFDYLARVTQLNVADAARLAGSRPAPDASLLTRALDYDTTLEWKPAPGAASYEIVWRATFEPLWTHARNVGNVTTFTFKNVPKDDWIFGVRAVDAAGHKGPAAYPQPAR